ncbi:hypothetical protein GCM10029992_23250 [Glycomyces albus]
MDFQIRDNRRKPQGARRLTAERRAFLQLMSEGVSNKEACRIVGIDERTGRKWRNGRKYVTRSGIVIRTARGRWVRRRPLGTGWEDTLPPRGGEDHHRRPAPRGRLDPVHRPRAGTRCGNGQPGDPPQRPPGVGRL